MDSKADQRCQRLFFDPLMLCPFALSQTFICKPIYHKLLACPVSPRQTAAPATKPGVNVMKIGSCQLDQESATVFLPDRTEVVIGDYAPLILVCDHQESRRQSVQQVISCCGAKPDFFDCDESSTTIQNLLSASPGQRSLVAVFAVGGLPSPDNRIVEMIHSWYSFPFSTCERGRQGQI